MKMILGVYTIAHITYYSCGSWFRLLKYTKSRQRGTYFLLNKTIGLGFRALGPHLEPLGKLYNILWAYPDNDDHDDDDDSSSLLNINEVIATAAAAALKLPQNLTLS